METPEVKTKIWSLVSFFILGLCNNFGYVVMLSSAHDILKSKSSAPETNKVSCSELSYLTNRVNQRKIFIDQLELHVLINCDANRITINQIFVFSPVLKEMENDYNALYVY